ncbi:MAG: 16S rRNA (cytosine(967)-C(5))-methyltransferase RsmB, partial [Candidatus Rokuibacteriota bacterium]
KWGIVGRRPPRPPSLARVVATRVLERVETDGAFADLALAAELDRRRAPTRDAALATELVYGTLRWQRYLDWVLQPHASRALARLDPRVRALLRMAAYQIVFLARVPAFAAVNDAVTLARGAPGTAGFVNAVLRSFTRRGAREREPRPPRDPLEALATRASFPTWLAGRWVDRYGLDDAETLMRALNERAPLTLRANTLRLTREQLAARLAAEHGLTTRPTPWAPEGLVVERGGSPETWRPFAEGDCVVQDEASMLIARLLEPRPGGTVADVCAAPGTKTTHLAALMEDRGRVLALEPEPARLGLVREAARRLGIASIEAHEGAVETLAPRFAAACDAVLVDAPCTNLGVVRRNPDVKWRRSAADLVTAAARQRSVLAAAATMVRPGGWLVYATCSLEPEENDAVVGAFLGERSDFGLDPPSAFPLPLRDDGVLRCLPHRHGTDGFTAFRLRRS